VKYADKAKLDEAMKAGGVDKWYQLFQKNSPTNSWSIPNVANGAPTLEPFVMNANDKGNVELVRNPYYWKVDPEGNQLPYIDKMSYVLVQDPEAIKLKAIAGEVDFEGLHSILKDYPLYKQNEAAGKYRTLLWNANFAGNICLMFNQNHKNPAMRTILSDVRFRQAVSMGIDRDEINKTIYLGKALMQQAVAYPSTSFYVKEYAEAFTKLDIDAANKLLDEMGFDKKDANGNRADADGKTLAITVEYWNGHAMQSPLELVCDQLRNNLHISITPKSIERTLWSEHMQASEHDATVWLTDKMSENFFTTYPNWLVPISTVESAFGNQWARWFVSNGKEGEEPTGEAKKQIDRYTAMQTASPEDVVKLGKELCQSQSENLWAIGTAATAPMPIVVNSNLANIPTEMPNYGWDWMFTHMTHQETWYFKA
jgi:peptide/nickel transport system substrate-binding protein